MSNPGRSPHPPSSAAEAVGPGPSTGPAIGTRLVVGLVILALGLAAFAVWFQWGQTRRCLAFYGPLVARSIQTAPRVELWSLATHGQTVRVASRLDISRAPGLVHLRRGLIEDVNFRWGPGVVPGAGPEAGTAGGRLPADAWDEALAFFTADGDTTAAAVVAFDLAEPGSATVVGHHGRILLGPIGPGLREWIDATKSHFLSGKSGF